MEADPDSPPSPNPPLEGNRVRLQPLGAEHAEALFPVLADPTLYVHLDHGPPASAARLAEVYRQLEARRSPDGQEYWLNWAVFALQPTTPMGFVQASVLADGRAWVAYVLGRAHQGQGMAGEAVGLMLEHLFQALGVHQAMATVERENARSIALLRRQGFSLATGDALHGHDVTETEQLWLRGPA